MFTKLQRANWNSLLASFDALPDNEQHYYESSFEKLLLLCVDLDVYVTTFLAACEIWKCLNLLPNKDLIEQYDCDTLTTCCVSLASEFKEVSIIELEQLQSIGPSDTQIRSFNNAQYRSCLLNILSCLNFDIYTKSFMHQFQQCVFFDSPLCSLVLVDNYADKHKHVVTEYDSETCVYQRVKLWYDFAVFFGYWRSDYLSIFIMMLIKNEKICSGCLLHLVQGNQTEFLKIICYGHKMLKHLQVAFLEYDLLYQRYKMPSSWSGDINDLFCDDCSTCKHIDVIFETNDAVALKKITRSVDMRRNLDVTQFERLCEGTYGKVYCERDRCYKEFKDDTYCREICIALSLNHRNILPLIDYGILANGHVWISSVFQSRDLHYLMTHFDIPLLKARKVMYSIASAIKYMHDHGILHFDLKPSNVLCSMDCEIVHLFDFTLSQQAKNRFYPLQLGFNPNMIHSIPYRPPELLFYDIYDPGPQVPLLVFAADLWAVGAIFFRLLQYCHQPLVNDDTVTCRTALEEILQIQATNVHLSDLKRYACGPPFCTKNQRVWNVIIENSNLDAFDLLDSLLNLNPEKRKTAQFVVNHPFFSNKNM